jgi:membrane fusion protein, heavy metal efflux system
MTFLRLAGVALLCGAALATASCGDKKVGAAPEAEEAAFMITHFTPASELFVEFPAFVVGEPSEFAAHLTDLRTGRSISDGQVVVRLVDAAGEERFAAQPSPTPGIFKPEARPKTSGKRRLLIELLRGGSSDVHDLGDYEVYASKAAALKANPPVEDKPGRIAFYKEQQWRVDFNTEPVATRPMRESIAVRVAVHPQPKGEAAVSAAAAGRVEPVGTFPFVGMNVRAGQPLFRLRSIGADAGQAAGLSADRSRAAAELTAARADLARVEGLLAQGAVARRRVDEARARVAAAQGAVNAASAGLAALGGAGGGVLTSPISGQVVEVTVQRGQAAASGAVLARVINPDGFEIEARVPEADVGRLTSISGIIVQPPGGEPILLGPPRAEVEAVGIAVDQATRTVPVVFEVSGRMPGLPIGLTTTGRLLVGPPRGTLAIPRTAVVDDAGLSVVYAMIDGEHFERRVIRQGASEGGYVEVLEGLKPGDRIVTRGAYLVRLTEAGPNASGEGHVH